MTLTEINEQMTIAQEQYEQAVKRTLDASELKEKCEIELIKADSAHKKARLELRLYEGRVRSLEQQGYNLRKEASIR